MSGAHVCMATVSTVPNEFVPTAASSVNASAGLRYDSILADACAFNRRLRKGRVNRLDFFDSATQIAQRPAPWLHRSVQARTKSMPRILLSFFNLNRIFNVSIIYVKFNNQSPSSY